MTGYTDIRAGGWVARLPEAWRPYALLLRLDRPIGVWLLFLPCLWSIAMAAPGWAEGVRLVLLFALGSIVMRGAGCVVNDLWDRKLDQMVERTRGRPLASGMISPRQALLFLAALLVVGLVILLQLNKAAVLMGVLALVPVALYPAAKRVTDWPQAVLGITFGWGAPLGYVACTGRLDATAIALHAATFFWILGYDTIYAHQDREDDTLVGIGSTALKFARTTRPFLVACYGAVVLLLLAVGVLAGMHWAFYLILLVAAGMLARQILLLDVDNPGLCLRLFKSNRWVGVVMAAGFLLGRL